MDSQLRPLESKVEYIYRTLQWLIPQIRGAQQTIRSGQAMGLPQSQSGGGSVYVCAPSSSIAAASAAPGTGTPGGPVNTTIYQIQSGVYVSIGTANVYNAMLTATAGGGRVLIVIPNGDGSYLAVAQSCT